MKTALLLSVLVASCAMDATGDALPVDVAVNEEGLIRESVQKCMNTGSKPFEDESNIRLGRLRNYMQRFCPVKFSCKVPNSGNPECVNANSYTVMKDCKANPPGSAVTSCVIYHGKITGLCEAAFATWTLNQDMTNYVNYSFADEDCGQFKVDSNYQEVGDLNDHRLEIWVPDPGLGFGGA